MSIRTRTTGASSSARAVTAVPWGVLQRTCACAGKGGECETCSAKRKLQRKTSRPADLGEVPPIVQDVLAGPGQPLDRAARRELEPRFGHDFSRVRVHTDGRAAQSARAVSALAYTVGSDIVFGEGRYNPGSRDGRQLLAHELTHVMQQSRGLSGGSESAAELEAEQVSAQVAAGVAGEVSPNGREPGAGAGRSYLSTGTSLQRVAISDPDAEQSGTAGEPEEAPVVSRESGTSSPEEPAAPEPDPNIDDGTHNPEADRFNIGPRLFIYRPSRETSFISTDTITLNIQVTNTDYPDDVAARVQWTVNSTSTNSGTGNPHTGTGASFSFRPNPTNRPTSGSRAPNPPIAYTIEAQADGKRATFDLVQDETDIMRQEYLDLGASAAPARSLFVTPTIPTYNWGNYSLIVDGGMDPVLNNVTTHFASLTQAAAAPAAGGSRGGPPAGPPAAPPATAVPAISVSSAYRNPRRNVWAGSNYPVTSRHVLGCALDLQVAGANATLWTRLRQAARDAGYRDSICENGAIPLPCTDPQVDHVHVEW